MKVLIVEDNPRLSERIQYHLNKLFTFDICSSGEEALMYVTQNQYSVIILDLGLPDMSGLEVCREIRKQQVQTPILILTGTDDVKSKVQLLDSGSDDYMTKPFDINELRSRISALQKRYKSAVLLSKRLEYKDLVLDPNTREVIRSNKKIALRRKEFDILECLLVNIGQVMSREAIMNYAWSSNTTSWNSTVDVHIKHLRDKVDRDFPTKYIKTIYGIGYLLGE